MIEKIQLFPSKRRIWLGFTASILLVGLACVMVRNGHMYGWFLIVFFSLGVIAPGILLLPGASWLQLDEEGFTLCMLFRPDRYLWSQISEISVWQGVVSFKLSPEHRGNKRGQATARAISGYDGSIPNMFQLNPESMAKLLIEYKQSNDQNHSGAPTAEGLSG